VKASNEVKLSRNPIAKQYEGMPVHVDEQLRKDNDACECFYLQFDESTDRVHVTQWCVFIGIVFEA